jgi:heat-inducible transcriptional repressor
VPIAHHDPSGDPGLERPERRGVPGLDARKAAILTAIVREYVHHAEPVGSKRIVETYELGVSAATVRNEMAALEEGGYIAQPHTSAGRVPTDQGYRYFVDGIDDLRPLDEAQRLALMGFLDQAHDLEELLRRTTQILAQLTHYASLALAPAIDRSRLKLIELVALNERTLLVLLIADTGRVVKRIVERSDPIGAEEIERTRLVLNETAAGLRTAEVPDAVDGIAQGAPPELRGVLEDLVEAMRGDLVRPGIDRVFVAGQAALAGERGFDPDELHQLFELLEEQATIGRVLAETAGRDSPLVRIGGENDPIEPLRAASIVAAGYGDDPAGSLGVLGPTRMDYPSVLAVVHAVAEHLQRTLRGLTEGDDSRGRDG